MPAPSKKDDAKQKDLNYYETFIRVADDCPVSSAVPPPPKRGEGKSIPQLEYELLADRPYTLTQEEVLFTVHLLRQGLSPDDPALPRETLRREFFSKSRACLRASMLPKKYGWGLHFDAAGRIALVPMESADYAAFLRGARPATVLAAMRNKRG